MRNSLLRMLPQHRGELPGIFRPERLPRRENNAVPRGFLRAPAVFPAVDIDGTLYRDGGVSDNTPVKPLYDIGIRRFIVSYLGSGGADLSNFPGAEFIELFPSDEIFLGKRENSVIAPGTLDFDGENAALRIELGRRETLEQLSETDLSSFLPANISG